MIRESPIQFGFEIRVVQCQSDLAFWHCLEQSPNECHAILLRKHHCRVQQSIKTSIHESLREQS